VRRPPAAARPIDEAQRRAIVDRGLLALLLIVLAVASMPRAASAHAGDHGKTVFFHDAYVRPDEVVDGDVNVVFGDARIAGTVRGDVNTLFGRCVKLDDAEIDGEEHCVTADAERVMAPWLAGASSFGAFADQDKRLLVKVGANAIVLLMFLLFPLRMRLALDRVERHPGLAAVAGAVALVAVVPVALLLLVSLIGIPLIAVEAAALLAGIWLGTGALAILIGRRLAELVLPTHTPSPLWALVLGLIVISAAETVPIVGWAVTAIVCLTGLGAAALAFVGSGPIDALRRGALGGPPMYRRPM
jgi:hypothetical protein